MAYEALAPNPAIMAQKNALIRGITGSTRPAGVAIRHSSDVTRSLVPVIEGADKGLISRAQAISGNLESALSLLNRAICTANAIPVTTGANYIH